MTTGVFNSAQATQDFIKKSFAAMITRLMPNGSAPLFGMTAMLKTETALQFEHGFFTKTMLFPQLTMSATPATSTDTVLNVVSTANVLPNMVMRVQSTGENILINSIISNTQVGVVRGVGTVAAAAISAATPIYQVGTAFEEGSVRPTALAINPVRITNYTQIFRNTWAITDSYRATAVIAGETNVAENRQDCAQFHAVDIEKALFFGQKATGTRNGMPIRYMDGLISIVGNIAYYPPIYSVPNVFTAGSTTNYTQLQGFLDPVFNQNTDPKVANERVLFVGGQARRVLNDIGRTNGTYYIVDGQTNYGLQFSTLKTARGTFRMIEHPLFNSNPDWAKMAVAVDLSSFNVAYLGDRKTKSQDFGTTDISDNGLDAVGGTLTTELTAIIKNPPANSIIYNLTASAVG